MIRISEQQYAAIGRVAVESGTLDRELREYLTRLGEKSPFNLGHKVSALQLAVPKHVLPAARAEFDNAIAKVLQLLKERNAVVHGVWSDASNAPVIGNVKTVTAAVALHASEIARVAAQLRNARKLLLVLCHDHCPRAVGNKKRPAGSAGALAARF